MRQLFLSFIGIAINIWIDTKGTGGGGGVIPSNAIVTEVVFDPIVTEGTGDFIITE